jgi:hypothetical protein
MNDEMVSTLIGLARAFVSNTLAQAMWLSRHKEIEGQKKHDVLIDVLYFVQETGRYKKLRRRTL